MAKVGDSYNCTMKQFMDVTPDKIYQKPLQEFTFVMKEDKIVFTVEGGYFAGLGDYLEMEVSHFRESNSTGEHFFVDENNLRDSGVFDDNHFNYTYREGALTQQMIAICIKY
jgi:hypothetical protein